MAFQMARARHITMAPDLDELTGFGALESRCQQLLEKLSLLCADREEILTRDSVAHIAAVGQVEICKWRPQNDSKGEKKRGATQARKERDESRQSESGPSLSRSKLEEYATLFLDRKAESALTGGNSNVASIKQGDHGQHKPGSESSHLEGQPPALSGAHASEIEKDLEEIRLLIDDPSSRVAISHRKLVLEPIDARVFTPLLLSVRDVDPLLYRAMLCYPLISGSEAPMSRDGDSRKKRKGREKEDFRGAMLNPDFEAAPLEIEDMTLNVSRFVCRAIADGSVEALLLAVKVCLALFKIARDDTKCASPPALPIGSHIRVLQGEEAPKMQSSSIVSKKDRTVGASAVQKGDSDLMDVETGRGSVPGENADDSKGEESKASEQELSTERTSSEMVPDTARNFDEGGASYEEGLVELDEEALMAQAIALSLSSGIEDDVDTGVEDKTDSKSQTDRGLGGDRLESQAISSDEKESEDSGPSLEFVLQNPKFSAEEMRSLPAFHLGRDVVDVPLQSVVISLLSHLDEKSVDYMASWEDSSTKIPLAVHPRPLTFLLLHSLLQETSELSSLRKLVKQGSKKDRQHQFEEMMENKTFVYEGAGFPSSDFENVSPQVEDVHDKAQSKLEEKAPPVQGAQWTYSALEEGAVRGANSSVPEDDLDTPSSDEQSIGGVTDWDLFQTCMNICLLRTLHANLFHIEVSGIAPASVGLGYVSPTGGISAMPSPSSASGSTIGERSNVHLRVRNRDGGNPLPQNLRAQVVRVLQERTKIRKFRSGFPADSGNDPKLLRTHTAELVSLYRMKSKAVALDLWVRALPYFYPTHSSRQRLLLRLLRVCELGALDRRRARIIPGAAGGGRNPRYGSLSDEGNEKSPQSEQGIKIERSACDIPSWRFVQLELLCERLLLPDMLQHFIPSKLNTSKSVDGSLAGSGSSISHSRTVVHQEKSEDGEGSHQTNLLCPLSKFAFTSRNVREELVNGLIDAEINGPMLDREEEEVALSIATVGKKVSVNTRELYLVLSPSEIRSKLEASELTVMDLAETVRRQCSLISSSQTACDELLWRLGVTPRIAGGSRAVSLPQTKPSGASRLGGGPAIIPLTRLSSTKSKSSLITSVASAHSRFPPSSLQGSRQPSPIPNLLFPSSTYGSPGSSVLSSLLGHKAPSDPSSTPVGAVAKSMLSSSAHKGDEWAQEKGSAAAGDHQHLAHLLDVYDRLWTWQTGLRQERAPTSQALASVLTHLLDSLADEEWPVYCDVEGSIAIDGMRLLKTTNESAHSPQESNQPACSYGDLEDDFLIVSPAAKGDGSPEIEDLRRGLSNGQIPLCPRVAFLRSVQDRLLQHVSGSSVEKSTPLELDANRCAETITLIDGHRSAKQVGNKQWGTVMATTGCPPGTGIYEWTVKLDRCEKGHVFLGVCTREAGIGTYIGGDRQGWGLIGTRALWHNRSKVRGDYGKGFTTGSTVRVRLNTDTGALSFGNGEGAGGAAAGSKGGNPLSVGREDEADWGIAFDGLTQSEPLYPAVGLYQKDDQVTIQPIICVPTTGGGTGNASGTALAVSRAGLRSSGEAEDGQGESPVAEDMRSDDGKAESGDEEGHAELQERLFLAQILSPLLVYTKHLVSRSSRLLAGEDGKSMQGLGSPHPFIHYLLPPLISSLTLLEHEPALLPAFAFHFIPEISTLVKCIEGVLAQNADSLAATISGSSAEADPAKRPHPARLSGQEVKLEERALGAEGDARIQVDVSGEWELRSMAADSIPAQQYVLSLVQDESGFVSGKSNGAFTGVNLEGTVRGTKIRFVEKWRQGGTCLVEGRLRVDGNSFLGIFEDAKTRTTGGIAGTRLLPKKSDTEGSKAEHQHEGLSGAEKDRGQRHKKVSSSEDMRPRCYLFSPLERKEREQPLLRLEVLLCLFMGKLCSSLIVGDHELQDSCVAHGVGVEVDSLLRPGLPELQRSVEAQHSVGKTTDPSAGSRGPKVPSKPGGSASARTEGSASSSSSFSQDLPAGSVFSMLGVPNAGVGRWPQTTEASADDLPLSVYGEWCEQLLLRGGLPMDDVRTHLRAAFTSWMMGNLCDSSFMMSPCGMDSLDLGAGYRPTERDLSFLTHSAKSTHETSTNERRRRAKGCEGLLQKKWEYWFENALPQLSPCRTGHSPFASAGAPPTLSSSSTEQERAQDLLRPFEARADDRAFSFSSLEEVEIKFAVDLVDGHKATKALDQWVSRHAGESVLLRIGGDIMKQARRAVVAVMIRHSGVFPVILHQLQSLSRGVFADEGDGGHVWAGRHDFISPSAASTLLYNDIFDIVGPEGANTSRPDEKLIHIWRAAQRVIEWAIRAKNATGSTYTVMAETLLRKARFLFVLTPSREARAASMTFEVWGAGHGPISPSSTKATTEGAKSGLAGHSDPFTVRKDTEAETSASGHSATFTPPSDLDWAVGVVSDLVSQVSRFMESRLRPCTLLGVMLEQYRVAFLRACGLFTLRALLGGRSNAGLSKKETGGLEVDMVTAQARPRARDPEPFSASDSRCGMSLGDSLDSIEISSPPLTPASPWAASSRALQRSAAVCALLGWLSPALRGFLPELESAGALQRPIVGYRSRSSLNKPSSSPSSMPDAPTIAGSNAFASDSGLTSVSGCATSFITLGCYASGLRCCGDQVLGDVRLAFESLYALLASNLQRATWRGDQDQQLSILAGWGVLIGVDDHAFLSRIGIFRILQMVLDEARGNVRKSNFGSRSDQRSRKGGGRAGGALSKRPARFTPSAGPTPTTEDHGLELEARRRVVQAALTVVHLLAAQVASSGEEYTGVASSSSAGTSSHAGRIERAVGVGTRHKVSGADRAMGSVGPGSVTTTGGAPLSRMPSGPETLGRSVFDMLFVELRNTVEQVITEARDKAAADTNTEMKTEAEPVEQERGGSGRRNAGGGISRAGGSSAAAGAVANEGFRLTRNFRRGVHMDDTDVGEASEYCFQICSLLYSVSSAPVCRSHLSSTSWLALFMVLIDGASNKIRRRVIRLLRRLLPHMRPEYIRAEVGGLSALNYLDILSAEEEEEARTGEYSPESRELESRWSHEEGERGGDAGMYDASGHVSALTALSASDSPCANAVSLVRYLVETVGHLLPPSVAAEYLFKRANSQRTPGGDDCSRTPAHVGWRWKRQIRCPPEDSEEDDGTGGATGHGDHMSWESTEATEYQGGRSHNQGDTDSSHEDASSAPEYIPLPSYEKVSLMANDIVSLLRSLLASPQWNRIVNSVLLHFLQDFDLRELSAFEHHKSGGPSLPSSVGPRTITTNKTSEPSIADVKAASGAQHPAQYQAADSVEYRAACAMAVLNVLGGHMDVLRVGAAVRVVPRVSLALSAGGDFVHASGGGAGNGAGGSGANGGLVRGGGQAHGLMGGGGAAASSAASASLSLASSAAAVEVFLSTPGPQSAADPRRASGEEEEKEHFSAGAGAADRPAPPELEADDSGLLKGFVSAYELGRPTIDVLVPTPGHAGATQVSSRHFAPDGGRPPFWSSSNVAHGYAAMRNGRDAGGGTEMGGAAMTAIPLRLSSDDVYAVPEVPVDPSALSSELLSFLLQEHLRGCVDELELHLLEQEDEMSLADMEEDVDDCDDMEEEEEEEEEGGADEEEGETGGTEEGDEEEGNEKSGKARRGKGTQEGGHAMDQVDMEMDDAPAAKAQHQGLSSSRQERVADMDECEEADDELEDKEEEEEGERRVHSMLLTLQSFRAISELVRHPQVAAKLVATSVGGGSENAAGRGGALQSSPSLTSSSSAPPVLLRRLLSVAVQQVATSSLSDLSDLEEGWAVLMHRWYNMRRKRAVQVSERTLVSPASLHTPVGAQEGGGEGGGGARDGAAAKEKAEDEQEEEMPSAICQTMMEMGFPREWCDLALARCGNNLEAALDFCFERSGDMDKLLKEEQERKEKAKAEQERLRQMRAGAGAGAGGARGRTEGSRRRRDSMDRRGSGSFDKDSRRKRSVDEGGPRKFARGFSRRSTASAAGATSTTSHTFSSSSSSAAARASSSGSAGLRASSAEGGKSRKSAKGPSRRQAKKDTQEDDLRNPLLAKMAEMGFPVNWCKKALAANRNNVDAALTWILSNGEALEAEDRREEEEKKRREEMRRAADAALEAASALSSSSSASSSASRGVASRRRKRRNGDDGGRRADDSEGPAAPAASDAVAEMDASSSMEAGQMMPLHRQGQGKAARQGSCSGVSSYSAEGFLEESDEEADHECLWPRLHPSWRRLLPLPVVAVSGLATISEDLTVEGIAGGGFASVGARSATVDSGKWYYEATLLTAGCIQIGWADTAFEGSASRGDGVGDGPHSWAYDGWRQQKWHGESTNWGARWQAGDVVGCAIDVDAGLMIFTLNGRAESVGMGVAFRGAKFAGGVFPCASFNRRESIRFNFGGGGGGTRSFAGSGEPNPHDAVETESTGPAGGNDDTPGGTDRGTSKDEDGKAKLVSGEVGLEDEEEDSDDDGTGSAEEIQWGGGPHRHGFFYPPPAGFRPMIEALDVKYLAPLAEQARKARQSGAAVAAAAREQNDPSESSSAAVKKEALEKEKENEMDMDHDALEDLIDQHGMVHYEEDSLEEYVGEENYAWERRYFGKLPAVISPSQLLRLSLGGGMGSSLGGISLGSVAGLGQISSSLSGQVLGGGGGGGGAVGGGNGVSSCFGFATKSQLVADMLSVADEEVRAELLYATRSLAVLHARRLLFSLLCYWPEHLLGPFSLEHLGLKETDDGLATPGEKPQPHAIRSEPPTVVKDLTAWLHEEEMRDSRRLARLTDEQLFVQFIRLIVTSAEQLVSCLDHAIPSFMKVAHEALSSNVSTSLLLAYCSAESAVQVSLEPDSKGNDAAGGGGRDERGKRERSLWHDVAFAEKEADGSGPVALRALQRVVHSTLKASLQRKMASMRAGDIEEPVSTPTRSLCEPPLLFHRAFKAFFTHNAWGKSEAPAQPGRAGVSHWAKGDAGGAGGESTHSYCRTQALSEHAAEPGSSATAPVSASVEASLPPLLTAFLTCVFSDLKAATGREYSRIPWCAGESWVNAALIQLSLEQEEGEEGLGRGGAVGDMILNSEGPGGFRGGGGAGGGIQVMIGGVAAIVGGRGDGGHGGGGGSGGPAGVLAGGTEGNAGLVWTDREAMRHPNVGLASWITRAVLSLLANPLGAWSSSPLSCSSGGDGASPSSWASSLSSGRRVEAVPLPLATYSWVPSLVRCQVFAAWAWTLRSPAMALKEIGASMLCGMLHAVTAEAVRVDADVTEERLGQERPGLPHSAGSLDMAVVRKQRSDEAVEGVQDLAMPEMEEQIRALLDLLPVTRIVALSTDRIARERRSLPICSRYMQCVLELSSAIRLAASIIGVELEEEEKAQERRMLEAAEKASSYLRQWAIIDAEFAEEDKRKRSSLKASGDGSRHGARSADGKPKKAGNREKKPRNEAPSADAKNSRAHQSTAAPKPSKKKKESKEGTTGTGRGDTSSNKSDLEEGKSEVETMQTDHSSSSVSSRAKERGALDGEQRPKETSTQSSAAKSSEVESAQRNASDFSVAGHRPSASAETSATIDVSDLESGNRGGSQSRKSSSSGGVEDEDEGEDGNEDDHEEEDEEEEDADDLEDEEDEEDDEDLNDEPQQDDGEEVDEDEDEDDEDDEDEMKGVRNWISSLASDSRVLLSSVYGDQVDLEEYDLEDEMEDEGFDDADHVLMDDDDDDDLDERQRSSGFRLVDEDSHVSAFMGRGTDEGDRNKDGDDDDDNDGNGDNGKEESDNDAMERGRGSHRRNRRPFFILSDSSSGQDDSNDSSSKAMEVELLQRSGVLSDTSSPALHSASASSPPLRSGSLTLEDLEKGSGTSPPASAARVTQLRQENVDGQSSSGGGRQRKNSMGLASEDEEELRFFSQGVENVAEFDVGGGTMGLSALSSSPSSVAVPSEGKIVPDLEAGQSLPPSAAGVVRRVGTEYPNLSAADLYKMRMARSNIKGKYPLQWKMGPEENVLSDGLAQMWSGTLVQTVRCKSASSSGSAVAGSEPPRIGSHVVRGPHWKWNDQDGGEGSVGVVESVSAWSTGRSGLGIGVRWPSQKRSTYRWAVDRQFDVQRVEVDGQGRVIKKLPLPQPALSTSVPSSDNSGKEKEGVDGNASKKRSEALLNVLRKGKVRRGRRGNKGGFGGEIHAGFILWTWYGEEDSSGNVVTHRRRPRRKGEGVRGLAAVSKAAKSRGDLLPPGRSSRDRESKDEAQAKTHAQVEMVDEYPFRGIVEWPDFHAAAEVVGAVVIGKPKKPKTKPVTGGESGSGDSSAAVATAASSIDTQKGLSGGAKTGETVTIDRDASASGVSSKSKSAGLETGSNSDPEEENMGTYLWFQELCLVRGEADMGWMARFGTDHWRPGTIYHFYAPHADSTDPGSAEGGASPDSELATAPHGLPLLPEKVSGDYRQRITVDGKSTYLVFGKLQMSRSVLFTMDKFAHAPGIRVSSDGESVTCVGDESRGVALGTVGFSSGVHYWEVNIEQAEFGSVMIGVAEKPSPPGSTAASTARYTRWNGWGFVNFRATFHNNTERIYGDHFNAGDTIGVRLDMERGKLAFFMDGIKYGEHIVSDLGVAFDNLQGEREGQSRTLFPAVGLRKPGDRVSINRKWVSAPGVSAEAIAKTLNDVSALAFAWSQAELQSVESLAGASRAGEGEDVSAAAAAEEEEEEEEEKLEKGGLRKKNSATVVVAPDEGMKAEDRDRDSSRSVSASTPPLLAPSPLPGVFLKEAWQDWKRWREDRWQRYLIRPRGLAIEVDTSRAACLRASKKAGLVAPFFAGDRVKICSSSGRELDQAEEAMVLGVYRDLLWFRTETQGHEGAEEGRLWAWYWSEHELGEIILLRRNGKDMTAFDASSGSGEISDSSQSSSALEAGQSHAGSGTVKDVEMAEADKEEKTAIGWGALEREAATSLSSFVALCAAPFWTLDKDRELVAAMNELAAAKGVEAINIRFGEVLDQAEEEATTSYVRRDAQDLFRLRGIFSGVQSLRGISGAHLRARCALLRVLNGKVSRALPYVGMDIAEQTAPALSGAFGETEGCPQRTLGLSTGLRLRYLRGLIFTSTKRAFWDWFLRATTTNTPLPSDEYEDPREIRVIRINRIQAHPAKLASYTQPAERLRRSVFGQLYREMRNWSDAAFRRAYCGKGHGGQKRAFKVKFLGEGVNDYGGPYRAVFEQVVDELQMDNVELVKGEQALLPLLLPCPNRRSGAGANQEKFVLNPSYGSHGSASVGVTAATALTCYRFLGKLLGTAVRHGLQMGLDLPSLVWKPMTGIPVNTMDLKEIDVVAAGVLDRLSHVRSEEEIEVLLDGARMTTLLSDGREVPIAPHGEMKRVSRDNMQNYIRLTQLTRLLESAPQLKALREGLAKVLPVELFPLFTEKELENLICGRRQVDVSLLRQCTEYEDVDENTPHVRYFWEVLEEMTEEDRTAFLRFVWARSRMPSSAKDFPMNFKIQPAPEQGARDNPDLYLPHAQTCFFSLSLPAYTSKEVLRSKLLFAIRNSPNMDADVRLHNAEGWADA